MAKLSDAEISSLLFAEQASSPTTPATGHGRLFVKSDGVYFVDAAGTVTGPFGASTPAASNNPPEYAIGDGSGHHSTTSATFTDIDAAYLLSVPATAGDLLEIEFIMSFFPSSTNYLRVCANVAGTDEAGGHGAVYTAISTTASSLAVFRTFYVVQAADISAGNVAVKPRWLTNGGATVTGLNDATLNRRPVFSVKNHGQ